LVDLHEIQWVGDSVEDDLEATIFNAVSATISKWQTFKFLRLMQNHETMKFCALIGLQRMKNF
jgi:hypothetical protein